MTREEFEADQQSACCDHSLSKNSEPVDGVTASRQRVRLSVVGLERADVDGVVSIIG
jgi:hypothetical protein